MVTKKKTAKNEKLLTEAELELMGILWKTGEAAVADVLAMLPPERKLAYTSVSTILRILEQKGVVGSRKEGRGHLYFAILAKEKYEATTLHHMVSKVFDGTPSSLVRRLLETESWSEGELDEIRELLRGKESGKEHGK
ncbi:MAG: BlaI/MecI/CopY family transcriptional regulator [Bdellovibrionota bacterium]